MDHQDITSIYQAYMDFNRHGFHMGSKISFALIFIPLFMAVAGFSLKDVMSYDTFLVITKTLGAQTVPLQTGSINMTQVFPDLVHPNCCGNSMPDFSEDEAKIFLNCTGHVMNRTEIIGENEECEIAQCVGRAMGVVNETGHVILTEFLKYAEKFYGPKTMKNMTQHFAPRCLECVDADEDTTCNFEMLLATRCVKYSVLANCPEDQKENSTSCDSYRTDFGVWNGTSCDE